MRLCIELLRDPDGLRDVLRRDGWKCEDRRHGAVVATHPFVTDEAAARDRLHYLGLLTSSFLRVEFCHTREHE
jgi:hypothetical protein